jgi:HEAT repeat protein
MHPRTLLLTCMVTLVLGVAVAQEKEPKYQGKTLAAWREGLKDRDAKVRADAAIALGRFGKDGKDAIKPLIEALGDKDENVRAAAALSLLSLKPSGKEAVTLLMVRLREKGTTPVFAVQVLGTMGKEPVAPLMAALRETETRSAAALALRAIGKDAAPELTEALKDNDARVRRVAAEVLGRIGPDAKTAVPGLLEACKDKDGTVREEAATAVKRIDPEAAKKAKIP